MKPEYYTVSIRLLRVICSCCFLLLKCQGGYSQNIQKPYPPLTKGGLLNTIKIGKAAVIARETTSKKYCGFLINLVEQAGVDFRLTDVDKHEIRKVGSYCEKNELDDLITNVQDYYKETVILITEINPEVQASLITGQPYRLADTVHSNLMEAVTDYHDIRVILMPINITQVQGALYAMKIGADNKADFVIWGWFDLTPLRTQIHISFTSVKRPQQQVSVHASEELDYSITEINNFIPHKIISAHMIYMTLVASGIARLEANDFNTAINRFNAALRLTPPTKMIDNERIEKYLANAFFSRAMDYRDKGSNDKAIDDLNTSINLNPDYWEAYFNRGILYSSNGKNYGAAISDFNKTVEIKPDYDYAYLSLGRALYLKYRIDRDIPSKANDANNDREQAIVAFRKARLSNNPDIASQASSGLKQFDK